MKEAHPVNTDLYIRAWLSNITFHLLPIWLRTLVSKLLHTASWSCCADDWNLSRRPFLGQVVYFDLLLCTGFDPEQVDMLPCPFLLRDHEWSKIVRCFGWQQVLANSIKNFISHNSAAEKKNTVVSDSSLLAIYKALKRFWLFNWLSITRAVAMFPQASQLWPAATAANSETPCVCARPCNPPKQCRNATS